MFITCSNGWWPKSATNDTKIPLMMRLTLATLIVAFAAPAMAQAPPALFQKALGKPAPAGQLYAYDFIDQRNGDNPGVTRGRIDPSRPKGDRVTILEATGEKIDLKKLDERYERDADGDIWCDKLINGYEGLVIDKGDSPEGRRFAFTPKPKPDAKNDEKKLYRQLAAEVAVDEATGTIRTFAARLLKPWKPMILAKLDSVEMTGVCETAPNGRPFAARMNMAISGTAMGSAFRQDMTQTVTNLRPAG
jgi:hypothetical protein